MILKILGAILIFLVSSMLGFLYSNRLKMRVDELGKIIYWSEYMSNQIRFNSLPLKDLFQQMALMKEFQLLYFVKKSDESMQKNIMFPEAFENALDKSKNIMNLEKEDYDCLINIKNDLGSTDIDGQVKILELFKTNITYQYEKAKINYEKTGQMYKKIGMLVGVALAIMLI